MSGHMRLPGDRTVTLEICVFDLDFPKNRFFHKNKAYDLTKLVLCNMDIFLLNMKDVDSKTILHKILCNMHIALRNMHIAQVSILRQTHISSSWFEEDIYALTF
jgi:hypothetical protein